jgi:hypothetical protein
VTVKNYRDAVTIDMLPDNVFLEIFDFCQGDPTIQVIQRMREWQRLVHVCQRWRSIIFSSPCCLDLRLSCSYGTPVRKNLVFWPVAVPLTVDFPFVPFRLSPEDEDNVVAALEHPGRVNHIVILGADSLLRKVAPLMQEPFPALTRLDLAWDLKDLPAPFSQGLPVIPGRFLGECAPRLEHLYIEQISVPELPTFLFSALVTLKLNDISEDNYISPEAMVGSLAVLTKLTTLSITFYDEIDLSEQTTRNMDPPMRAILPALTIFHYRGCSEYLDDFLAQIDTPHIDNLKIEYFMIWIQIPAPQLSQFINRTENLRLDRFRRSKVIFDIFDVSVELDHPQGKCRQAQLCLKILGQQGWLDKRVPCVAHVLGQLVATFSNVDHLIAHGDYVDSGEMDLADWLPFFRLFPAAEGLHLSGGVAAYIPSVLEDTADSEEVVTDVFPVLNLIWLDQDNEDCDEPVPVGSIEQFLSLRRHCGRPVTVVNTQDEFLEADRRPL